MAKESLLSMIKSTAREKLRGKEGPVTAVHMLAAYADVLALSENALLLLIPDARERETVERMRNILDAHDVDPSLFKKGTALLIDRGFAMEEEEELSAAMASDTVPPDTLLSQIIRQHPDLIKLFRRGQTLEGISEYCSRQTGQTEKTDEPEKTDASAGDAPDGELSAHSRSTKTETGRHARFSDLSNQCEALYRELAQKIFGQEEAIRVFVEGFFQAELMAETEQQQNSPRGIFLFAGPPGVGKTYLATLAAEHIGRVSKRFDMSAYSDNLAHQALIGTPPIYGNSKSGELTTFVRENPGAVLIFDEIEKCHSNTIHIFLQILDAGWLRDESTQQNISFRDTILIFTTNAGKALYEDADSNLSLLNPSVVLDALEKERKPGTGDPVFPAAICSRFAQGNIVMFNHLDAQNLVRIVENQFAQCDLAVREKYGWHIRFEKEIAPLFLFSRGCGTDARIASSKGGQFIRNEMYEFSRLIPHKAELEKLEEMSFSVQLDESPEAVRKLFRNDRKYHVLMVGDAGYDAAASDCLAIHCAASPEEMNRILEADSMDFACIDPKLGCREQAENGFSLEDWRTDGMDCLFQLRERMPKLPLFLISEQSIREADEITFRRLGVRGVIAHSDTPEQLTACLSTMADRIYLQKNLDELTAGGKVLEYNTVQKLSPDGRTAQIAFYDFRISTAVAADSRNLVMRKEQTPDVRFSDVIGAKNAKEELLHFVERLRNPHRALPKKGHRPKGILLYGPPGTGKTMLAKAMAGEAGVTFLPTAATDFMNRYVGEGEKAIRKLFAAARRYAPSIIFIDEIDAIAKERTGEFHTETYLNALLTEMDGFVSDDERPVFVIAATNFPLERKDGSRGAVIDPALLRRFDNRIYVDLPDKAEREEFLTRQLRASGSQQVSPDAISNMADRTTGESLANLQNILNLAERNAEKQHTAMTDRILLDAMESFFYGEEHKWGSDYYEAVARHESGHAYVRWLSGRRPSFVTIVSRGDFGGYMQSESAEKTPNYTKSQLEWEIRTCLAGRAAEIVFYGEEAGINTGASSDLRQASRIALQMICDFGMSETGLLSLGLDQMVRLSSGKEVLQQADEILEAEMEETIRLVREGQDKVNQLSRALLENNQLTGTEIQAIFEEEKPLT